MPTVRIAHSLTHAEVRQRMQARVGDLRKLSPGGMAKIEHHWINEDRLAVIVTAMGQRIESVAEVEPGALAIHYSLPAGAGFIAPMVEGVIRKAGDKLLLEKK
jgi:hypothetical protein